MVSRKKTSRLLVIILIGLAVLTAGCAGSTAQAQGLDTTNARTISVWGSGQTAVQPDRAVLTIGVETTAAQASAALSQNSKQVLTTLDALQQAGVAKRDIQTQSVQLYSRIDPAASAVGPDSPAIGSTKPAQSQTSGYTAVNTVQVLVRDLSTVGALLDAAVKSGGNRIQGLRFEVSDPDAALQQARELAWQDAQNKARQLATLGNVQLGEVISVQESNVQPLSVVAQTGTSEVPVEPGVQSLQVSLNVTWQVR